MPCSASMASFLPGGSDRCRMRQHSSPLVQSHANFGIVARAFLSAASSDEMRARDWVAVQPVLSGFRGEFACMSLASPLAFQHRSIGRRTHPQGTAGAHMRYITRASACTHFEVDNMPEACGAAISYFDRLAERPSERINARVCDKLIIALPLSLAVHERHQMVRSFMRNLGRGRIPWCAAFHDDGKDGGNPHVHVVFRDRDIDTNRRVIGTSASAREVSQARLGGTARPPLVTAEALRLAWREHLASFYADRAVAADTGRLLSQPASAFR